jgi:hypothetical protein
LDAMRIAYMAGAQHLFSSIMTILEPGQMETEADVSRLDLIDKELDKFAQELALRTTRARGGA